MIIMYTRTMSSLFPLILGSIAYYIQMVSFPNQPFSMYLISAIPAGWSILNRYKRPMTDTDIIIREIRFQHTDGVFELIFFAIRKGIKLAIAFTIGWLMVPYLMFEVVSGIAGGVRNRRHKRKRSHEMKGR